VKGWFGLVDRLVMMSRIVSRWECLLARFFLFFLERGES